MANFTAIVDADRERRERYIARVASIVAPVTGLQVGRMDCGAFSAIWAVNPSAPLSTWQNGVQAGLVWGDAIQHDSGHRLTAEALAGCWNATSEIPPAYDGYYAAITFSDGVLTAGADLLGLFPVYYSTGPDLVIVSSTAELIRQHPSISNALSVEGLAGILLMDALVQNRTLWRDIYRLNAGRALVGRADGRCVEVPQFELPVSERPVTHAFADDIEEFDRVLRAALRRQTAVRSPRAIMLSGGRDSRQLAGYLDALGQRPTALTMGERQDYEVQCARRVARALGWNHQTAAADAGQFAANARLHATWEHLSSGFCSPHLWGMIEPLRAFAPSFVTGYLADMVAGAEAMKLHTRPGRVVSFDFFFQWANSRGVQADTLKQLLPRHDIVDSAIESIHAQYKNSCGLEEERLWRFQLGVTERLRVGAVPWRMTFGSWPVLPLLDRAVLDTVATLPVDSIANRRAQNEILRKHFPKLARIPIVVWNADVHLPLLPSLSQRLRHRLTTRLKNFRRKYRAHEPERRYTWRMYDFNGAGWQQIRLRAEPNRERLGVLFDLDEVSRYLPPPHVHVAAPTFESTMGRKLLLGVMLWAETHLS